MVFSSHIFLFYFLPAALGLYFALHRCPQRWRNVVLIVTGYAFYGWAEPMFMPLMFATEPLEATAVATRPGTPQLPPLLQSREPGGWEMALAIMPPMG